MKQATVWQEGKVNISLEELFFFGFFILLSITKGLGFYEGQKIFELLTLVAFACGIVKIVITPYTKKQWAMQGILLLLTAVTIMNPGSGGFYFWHFWYWA